MATVGIEPNLNISEEIADFLLFLLKEDRIPVPKPSLQQIITAKGRPGLSAEIMTAEMTRRFSEVGIPTGSLVGGTPNVMELFVKHMMEVIVEAIQSDMRVDISTDAGATVTAAGANGGGPVSTVGATTVPHSGVGIAS